MSKPFLPIPMSPPPDPVSHTTGEGAQTALTAMIRQRKMAENNVDEHLADPAPAPVLTS